MNSYTEYLESIEQEKTKNPDNYLKRCGDCGRFVAKKYWIEKNHPWKHHPLCPECFSNYD
ncbi:MAG: hypothetical protein Q7J27_08150 [Syntrophales bacterium]|nr:hypothetical protein [Syntrophales bacterium]